MQRISRFVIGTLGILSLLLGLTTAEAATATQRDRLERRILAARDLFRSGVKLDVDTTIGGDRLGSPTRLTQWWPNWPNWGNWPNWPNWGNWGNWFNR